MYVCIYQTLHETISIKDETENFYRYCMYIKCRYLSSQCSFVIKNVYSVLAMGKSKYAGEDSSFQGSYTHSLGEEFEFPAVPLKRRKSFVERHIL